jgi:hypothetical protein
VCCTLPKRRKKGPEKKASGVKNPDKTEPEQEQQLLAEKEPDQATSPAIIDR